MKAHSSGLRGHPRNEEKTSQKEDSGCQMAQFAKSTFSHASYATFRPSYPPSLYKTVLAYHHGPKATCIDLGCGHGLISRALASTFTHVIGTDPSKGMIETALSSTPKAEFPNVEFRESSAEDLPFVGDESVDLVVSGQAAHWFDQARIWPEMRRVVRRGGTLAFWSYKDHVFVDFPRASGILDDYAYNQHKEKLGSYWSQPGRSMVQNQLRDVRPPDGEWEDLRRIEYEPGTAGPRTGEGTMFLSRRMKIGECKSYIRTWSAFSAWQESHPGIEKRESGGGGGGGDVVDWMFDDMRAAEPEWREDREWEEKEVDMEWGSALLLARRR